MATNLLRCLQRLGFPWFPSDGFGAVFRVDTNGGCTVLHSFDGTNGAHPVGPLLQDLDGTLFGTTWHGGTYDRGTVWKLSMDGTFTSLVSFDGTNGARPFNGLVQGTDGIFYGTTREGGTNPPANYAGGTTCGTFFKITRSGVLTSLISFSKNDCVLPSGTPEQGPDGNWYCTSYFGGDTNQFPSLGSGTVFQLTPSGKLNILVAFHPVYAGAWVSGGNPRVGLVPGPNGSFYGVSGTLNTDQNFIFQVSPGDGDNLTDPVRAVADDDGDGFSNLLEFAVGSDLVNPGDVGDGLVIRNIQQSGTNFPAMTFKRRVDAATLELQYVPEISSDGQTWYSDATHLQEFGVTPQNERFDRVTVMSSSPVGSAPTFWRLRVAWGFPISSPSIRRSTGQTPTSAQIRSPR